MLGANRDAHVTRTEHDRPEHECRRASVELHRSTQSITRPRAFALHNRARRVRRGVNIGPRRKIQVPRPEKALCGVSCGNVSDASRTNAWQKNCFTLVHHAPVDVLLRDDVRVSPRCRRSFCARTAAILVRPRAPRRALAAQHHAESGWKRDGHAYAGTRRGSARYNECRNGSRVWL